MLPNIEDLSSFLQLKFSHLMGIVDFATHVLIFMLDLQQATMVLSLSTDGDVAPLLV